MNVPRTPDPNRPPMHSLDLRLENEVWKKLRIVSNIGVSGGRDLPNNTLAKVVRSAVARFLALGEADQECPRVMRKRTNWKAGGRGTIRDPPKLHRIEIPEADYQAMVRVTKLGFWPSTAEVIRYALDLWIDANGRFDEEWGRWHDLSRDAWVERPRPLPPEGTIRTVEEHNAWRNATHPKPRPKRRIYKKRRQIEEA